MNEFKEISPESVSSNPFKLIGKEWMLITAGNEEKANAMTASWGGMGVMYGKNTAYVVIRPQRYTREFVDREETFSLNFFDKKHKETLNYMGMASGRNEDKITKSGLTLKYTDGTPYFNESKLILICKKLFRQPLDTDCLIDESLKTNWYSNGDNHILYIAEIIKAYKK